MSTPLGYPNAPPVPLSDVRPIMPDAGTFRYGWGFLEDTMPGWWLVTVEEDRLTACWYALGRGLEGIVSIPKSGPAEFLQVPPCESTCGVLPDMAAVVRARIRLAGSGAHGAALGQVLFNGQPLQTGKPLVYFDSRQFIDIPKELFPCIETQNELTVELQNAGESVGAAVIELLLDNGRIVRSGVSPFYTTNAAYAERLPHAFALRGVGKAVIPISFQLDAGQAEPFSL